MSIPQQQEATAALLARLAGRSPIETHISLIFVGEDTVWKLKKAVKLPFLDFTGMADRRRFIARELALNAPAAPGLYRDMVAVVCRPDGSLALAGASAIAAPSVPAAAGVAGEHGAGPPSPREPLTGDEAADTPVVDWVLRMARVPERDFLDVIAATGALTPAMQDALADAVAAYHLALPPLPDMRPPMREIVLGNVASAREAGLPEPAVLAWRDAVLIALAALQPALDARAAGGLVRRAHGDLHLGNLCLWHGRPVPFDALEFDETLATTDLAYDLAFLLMDLERRVGRAAANRVLNRYVARTGDVGLVATLPVMMSIRAMVRAHVEARSGHPDRWRPYLDSARAYLQPSPALVVAVGGLPGTGKSTLARALAPQLGRAPGALIVRSDEIRKRQNGVPPEQRLPQSAYDDAASTMVFAALAEAVGTAASGGQCVVADATFVDPLHRQAVEQAAGRAGVPFIGLWLEAPLPELERRIIARSGDASDATLAVLHAVAAGQPSGGAWHPVDSRNVDSALPLVRSLLERHIVPR
jgi:hypothetical protein